MRRGLIYNLFVTCFGYYLLGYLLNRISARRTIGMAPAFRYDTSEPGEDRPIASPRRRAILGIGVVVVMTSLGLARFAGPAAATLRAFWNGP
jgi:hypothetical protein